MIPETSILIPSYNNGRFLMECIGSILRQDYQDYEIVIIDDHSTDNTENIVKSLMAIDDRIKYYQNKRGEKGLVSALNYGIGLCLGEFIARMDADDMMIGHRLSSQVFFLKNNANIHAVCSGMQLIDENGLPTKKSQGTGDLEKSKLMHLFLNMYVHATMTVKREVFTNYKYKKDFAFCEDYELWSRVLQRYNIMHLPDIHHIYRVYPKRRIDNELRKQSIQSILTIFSNQLDFYKITHNERELLLHYSIFYLERHIGNKSEIEKWLNKVFSSTRVKQIFRSDTISEVKEHLYGKVMLNL